MDQEFLFINHDATNIDARIDSRAINAHVQRYHRKQRRKKNQRPLVCSLPVDELGIVHSQRVVPVLHSSLFVPSDWKNEKLSSPQGVISSENEPIKNGTGDRRQLPSLNLTSILQNGNSDPFSALAAPITPSTNLLLSWHRDIDIPSLYPFEGRYDTSSSMGMLRDWQQAITAIHDPYMVHAFISAIAAWMALSTGRQDCNELGLASKIKSSQMFRTYSASDCKWTSSKLYNVLIYMFWAEIAAEDMAPAGLHLRMLHQLIKTNDNPKAFDPWWRERIMYADVEYATTQLTRPLFDVDQWSFESSYTDWVEGSSFEAYWDSNLKMFLIDPSIEDEALKVVFSTLKKTLAAENFYTTHQLPTTLSVFRWMEARKTQCESQLLRIYAESFSLMQRSGSLPIPERQLIKSCTCLAAICWLTVSFEHTARKEKRKKFLLLELQEAVSCCESLLLPRLRFWILFVGAALEQSLSRDLGGTSGYEWHQLRLRMQANLMGIQSSQHAQQVLLAFLFLDTLKFYWPPSGSSAR